MVLLNNAGPVAEEFYTFVQRGDVRAIFRQYGFTLPGQGKLKYTARGNELWTGPHCGFRYS